MDDKQQESIRAMIIDGFTNTLLPIFSWFLSRFLSGIVGCKLTMVLLHPTATYRNRIADTWVKNNELFSCAEVLKMSFQTASGKRRCRKKLKKLLGPLFREMKSSREFLLLKQHFHEEWSRLKVLSQIIGWLRYRLAAISGAEFVPVTEAFQIPPKARIEIDIAKVEKRRDEEFSSYSSEDVIDAFPIGQTIKPRLIRRVLSEVGDYGQTVQGLWWEVSRDWNLIRQLAIKKNSRVWALLEIDPDSEPDIEGLIDMAMDFALGKLNEDKVIRLARWVMGKMLVSRFLEDAYSEKQVISLETPVGENLTLGHLLPDKEASDRLERIEERATLDSCLELLPASQREDSLFFAQADNLSKRPHEMRHELGDKKYEAKQRNFERALKRLTDLRESGRLPT